MIDRLYPAADRTALIATEPRLQVTYAELHDLVGAASTRWHAPRKALAFLLARNDLPTVLALLTLRAAGHAVALLDAALAPDLVDALVEAYQPEFIVGDGAAVGNGGETVDLGVCTSRVLRRETPGNTPPVATVHPLLGLCLATSGSTGSPKFVRLAETAVIANARGIATALSITPDDRAITCLPLHYAYGLSILTSHLAAGATVVLTGHGVMAPEFWTAVRDHEVTALAGVPYTYDMLRRLGLARVVPESVRVMTQAGGKLADAAVLEVHAFMQGRGGRFFVMYGQTEATARMAIMPSAWLPERVGAVGCAIPGGVLQAQDEAGGVLDAGIEGEIVYRGPNVMLGYASRRADLALGDSQHGVLRTGDLGCVERDGAVRIRGRLKRIGKLFGVRVDLDAVEGLTLPDATSAVIEATDRLIVFASGDGSFDVETLRARIASRLRVQQRAIDVRRVDTIPRTSAGKIDYPQLRTFL